MKKKEVTPIVDPQIREAARVYIHKRNQARKLASIITACIISAIGGFGALSIQDPWVLILIPIGLLLGLIIYLSMRGNTHEYINTIVRPALSKHYGPDFVLQPEGMMPASLVASSQLIRMGNRYSSDMVISGKYKDIQYYCANVYSGQLDYVVRRVGNKMVRTQVITNFFDGVIIRYNFNKPVNGRIEVREKRSGVDGSLVIGRDQTVEMEDIDFNKGYTVYTTDDHLAFYIITPQFIDALKEIKKTVVGGLIFAFFNGTLFIAIEGAKNKFEPEKVISEETIQRIIKEIAPLQQFVDWFNLDSNLFNQGKGE